MLPILVIIVDIIQNFVCRYCAHCALSIEVQIHFSETEMSSKSDVSDDESPISSDTEDDEEATVMPTPVCIVNECAIEDQPKNITFKNIKDGDAKRFDCFEFLLRKLLCF